MAEEQAEDTSSCSCEDDQQSNSAKYEESIITSDNDLDQDIEVIEKRQKLNIGDKDCTNNKTISTGKAKAGNPSTSYTIEDAPTTSQTVDADSRPAVTCVNSEQDTLSHATTKSSGEKNVRTFLPYPSYLGSFKVRSTVTHNDFLFRPGDIVSLTEDGRIYFAQIKALVENTFCEKYAAIIWLIPTNSSESVQNAPFNPDLFIYGLQDENFYTMDAITFVMHAPTPYYKRFISPVPESNYFGPRPEKKKRRKCKSKRDNIRLPVSIANLI